MTTQSGLEVRPQHEHLRGQYGGPGPALHCHNLRVVAQERIWAWLLPVVLKTKPLWAQQEGRRVLSAGEPSIPSLAPSTASKSWCMEVYLKVNASAHSVKSIYKVNRESYFVTTKQHHLLMLFILFIKSKIYITIYFTFHIKLVFLSKKLITAETLVGWWKVGWRHFYETASFV